MTDTLTGRQLDRALAEALGWRAEQQLEPTGVYKGTPIWALLDRPNHVYALASRFDMTPDELWQYRCPPFSADTPEGWAAMRVVVERMRELGHPAVYAQHYHASMAEPPYWVWLASFGPEQARGATLPEATARASLAALSAKEATDA